MTIFEAIRTDHDTQRNLLNKLVETSGDTAKRTAIYNKVKKQLKVHADAEERHFYKPLISNDMMQDHARHGIAEHHEIDELLEQLDNTSMDQAAWLKIAKNLQEKVTHHLDDEEHSFFQLAGKVFTANQKNTLAKAYQDYMQTHL
ncbi:hemerythrin domain-containing protein [Bizionia sediminis]|uniref:Hemerythrin domain-containing protein n=1 Tax=Bizionia sediminis TaxID=1737064 RepID=A0ABW5KP08_9FLAO